MKVAYKAYDETGTEVSDSIEATSIAEATERLRQRGLYVTSMNEDAGPPEAAPAAVRARRPQRGGRLKNVAIFARQLAVLIRTGTPLAQALQAVTRQAPPGPWRTVLTDLHRQIEEGNTLSHSMELHPTYFDPVCTSLIAAGESSGQLEKMLDRLSNLTRQQLKIRRSVTAALIYPILLGVVGITVVTVMIGFVLPRFKDLFLSLDAPLPPTTELLMAFSDFLRAKWWLVAIVGSVAGVGLKLAASTAAGRRAWDTAAVRLPYIGDVVRSLVTARLARLLGVLLESQVPLLDALRLTRESTGNGLYAGLIGDAEDAVERGEALSAVLARSTLITPALSEAIRHGEQSGQVSPVLLDMADFMDEENDVIVRTISKLLEPIMLIILGVVVGFIALSIFLPLFDLTSLAHGG